MAKASSYEADSFAEVSQYTPQVNGGYEDCYMPPTAPPISYEEMPQMVLPDFPALTNDAIRKACYEYINETCCYGNRAVRDMIFTTITNSCSMHYKLESFGEKRQSASRSTPYYGQRIDGPENGPVPGPWQIRVDIPNKFQDGKTYLEIPHTAYVKTCWKCDGCGKVDCSSCGGDGWNHCSSCNGRGKDSEDETCWRCNGSGRDSCSRCSGSGRVECSVCSGHGKLKHYRELIVTWKNHPEDFVANPMNLPIELITSAAGREVFTEERPAVQPITYAVDPSLVEASCHLINKHAREFPNELILMQRQSLRAVPITKVTYNWRRKTGEFYVYSYENNVYFENYPQKCFCCVCC